MAVDSATLTTASGVLKEVYLPGIVNQVNNPNAFLAEVEKSGRDIKEDMQGKYAVFAVRLGLSQSVGARAELGTLPAPQRTLVKQAQASLKYVYGVIRVSGPFMESAKTDKQAFIRGIRSESEGIVDSMKLDLNRQVWGDGTGLIATCGVATSLTVPLASDTNMLYLQVGMLVDIKTISTGADISSGNSREIVAIDEAAKTVTLDTAGGAVTVDATVGLFREDARNQELTGLDKIVDSTGALYTINPATAGDERWKATEVANFGSFTLEKLQEQVDAVHDNSGEWITHIFSQGKPRRLYLNQLTAERRFAIQENPKKLNGGFKGLAYTGGGDVDAAWVKDPYTQQDRIYGITMPMFEMRRQKDFEFIEIGGSVWLPDIFGSTGVDAYKAVLCTYAEIVCKKRNANFKLLSVVA